MIRPQRRPGEADPRDFLRNGAIFRSPCEVTLSNVFAGPECRRQGVSYRIWLVSFLEYDLGYFDQDEDRAEPGPNLFTPNTLLTMCPV